MAKRPLRRLAKAAPPAQDRFMPASLPPEQQPAPPSILGFATPASRFSPDMGTPPASSPQGIVQAAKTAAASVIPAARTAAEAAAPALQSGAQAAIFPALAAAAPLFAPLVAPLLAPALTSPSGGAPTPPQPIPAPPGSVAALNAAPPSAVPGVSTPSRSVSPTASGATQASTPGAAAAAAMSVGAPGTLSYTLNQIKQYESVGIANGLGISPYSLPPSANINFNQRGALHSEASGAYQFQPGTWRIYTNLSGIGQEYPQAYLAPPAVQDAVAAWAAINGPGINSTGLWAASAPPGGYTPIAHVDVTPQQLLAGGVSTSTPAGVNPKTGLAITADVNPGTLTRSDINAAPPPSVMPTLPGGSNFTQSLYGGQLQWGSLPQSYQAALIAKLGANAPAAYEATRAGMASATEQARAALGYGTNVLLVAPPTSQQVIAGINPNPYSTAPVNLASMGGGMPATAPGAPTVGASTPSLTLASWAPGLGQSSTPSGMTSATVPPGNSSIGSTLGGMAAALGNMFGGFAPTFSGGSAFSGPPGGSSGADFSSQNQTMPGSGGGFF